MLLQCADTYVLIGAGLVLPLVAAGVVVLLLLVTAVLLLRRRKSVEGEGGGSSIVVYPTHQSGGPQFLWVETGVF